MEICSYKKQTTIAQLLFLIPTKDELCKDIITIKNFLSSLLRRYYSIAPNTDSFEDSSRVSRLRGKTVFNTFRSRRTRNYDWRIIFQIGFRFLCPGAIFTIPIIVFRQAVVIRFVTPLVRAIFQFKYHIVKAILKQASDTVPNLRFLRQIQDVVFLVGQTFFTRVCFLMRNKTRRLPFAVVAVIKFSVFLNICRLYISLWAIAKFRVYTGFHPNRFHVVVIAPIKTIHIHIHIMQRTISRFKRAGVSNSCFLRGAVITGLINNRPPVVSAHVIQCYDIRIYAISDFFLVPLIFGGTFFSHFGKALINICISDSTET